MPIGSRNNRSVIRRNGVEVGLQRLRSVENQSGEAVHDFGDEETIRVSIRPGETARFAIGGAGQEDSRRLVMDVLEADDIDEQAARDDPAVVYPPIEEDDRILHDGQEWRAVQRQKASKNGFARFVLKEDGRGGGASGPGDTGDDGSEPGFTV